MPKTNVPDLCYVYCAVERQPPAMPAAGMPAGGPPRPVVLDDAVTLIVSAVPAATYAADALEPRLADLDWVGDAGAAHHQVVDALVEHGALALPFRLFSLFSSEESAVAALRPRRDDFQRAFDRIRGRQEWVLRIGLPEPGRAEAAPPPTAPASGTNFLQAKAAAKREAATRAARVKEDAAATFEALEQLADDARTRPVDSAGRLLLDAAFLVPPARVEALREVLTRTAARLLRDGCRVSLTGPWPAYSFASMDGARE